MYGRAHFKEGADLWCLNQKGMMPPPDFGVYLSRDRFGKILRYWAFGVTGDVNLLREKPWEEVDIRLEHSTKTERRS